MTLKQALAFARAIFNANHIPDVQLESEILLRHILHISQTQLYLELNSALSLQQETAYRHLVNRRLKDEPAAYITNHREFYGLDFYVDHRVLIPRPETETLLEKALELAKKRSIKSIADIGTGCGAIAICLAKYLPDAAIYATDISEDALEVARLNSAKHSVSERITFLQGNLLEPLPAPVDLITGNLPYVRKSELSSVNTTGFEPSLALDGGDSGLDQISQLCHQAVSKLNPKGCLLLEIGAGQKTAVVNLLQELFPHAKIEVTRDLGGIERVVGLFL